MTSCKDSISTYFPTSTKNIRLITGFIFWIILYIIIRIVDKLPTRQTEVFEADLTISHMPGSTVPIYMVYILCYVIPCLITLLCIFVFQHGKIDLYAYFDVLYATCEAYTLSEIVIKSLKVITGRPRPSFFALCGYPYNVSTGLYGTLGHTVDLSLCGNPQSISYAFSSFPSGHSSVAMSGSLLFILVFFIVIYPQLTSQVPFIIQKMISLIWCFALMFIALYIGASRFFDFKHFISDIFAGFIIGGLGAVYAVYSTYVCSEDNNILKKKTDNDIEMNL